jgi:hypothetical protein
MTSLSGFPHRTVSEILVWAFALSTLAAFGGCAVTEAARSEPGIDISSIRPGASREQVEAALGKPGREWVTALGVRYCIYTYYGGKGPAHGDAATWLFLDVASLGLAELFYQIDSKTKKSLAESGKRYPLMAVSYDDLNVVIGVFPEIDQFTALPLDGVSPATATPDQSSAPR